MEFFTEVQIQEFPQKIGYSSRMVLMGSCFAEEIGNKLKIRKYNVDLNPFGILYNPVSIANSLKILLKKRLFSQNDLFFKNDLWFSFNHHGRFSSEDGDKTLEMINSRITLGAKNIRNADYLFLTFGTAWVYELKSTGQVVTNCHKVPDSEFRRYRLPVQEITEVYREILQELWLVNPELKIVFTVSPIRHWKDGAMENQVSKATLLVAINNIIENCGNGLCSYFPSYEIVMDELRDYRFYADDMIHLSEVAVNHIWDKFEKAIIEPEAQKISKEVLSVQRAVAHRPVNRNTPEFRKFVKSSLKKIDFLQQKYAFLNFNSELTYFEEQLGDF